jgi:hypothetical protein
MVYCGGVHAMCDTIPVATSTHGASGRQFIRVDSWLFVVRIFVFACAQPNTRDPNSVFESEG